MRSVATHGGVHDNIVHSRASCFTFVKHQRCFSDEQCMNSGLNSTSPPPAVAESPHTLTQTCEELRSNDMYFTPLSDDAYMQDTPDMTIASLCLSLQAFAFNVMRSRKHQAAYHL